MAVYGYARISTKKQSIERQIRNIKEAYPEAVIVSETYTGTSLNRQGWASLNKSVKSGDIIVFDSVSRMSRDADDGCFIYNDLYQRGVELVFLKEPTINTAVYRESLKKQMETINTGDKITDDFVNAIMAAVNKLMSDLAEKQIRIAFEQAEKEVMDLRQRTKEGLQTAKLEGKQVGGVVGKKLTTKKSVKAKDIIRKHCKEFGGTLSDPEVITLAKISRNSFYKYKREIREELDK